VLAALKAGGTEGWRNATLACESVGGVTTSTDGSVPTNCGYARVGGGTNPETGDIEPLCSDLAPPVRCDFTAAGGGFRFTPCIWCTGGQGLLVPREFWLIVGLALFIYPLVTAHWRKRIFQQVGGAVDREQDSDVELLGGAAGFRAGTHALDAARVLHLATHDVKTRRALPAQGTSGAPMPPTRPASQSSTASLKSRPSSNAVLDAAADVHATLNVTQSSVRSHSSISEMTEMSA
jgi:hypothetical protein